MHTNESSLQLRPPTAPTLTGRELNLPSNPNWMNRAVRWLKNGEIHPLRKITTVAVAALTLFTIGFLFEQTAPFLTGITLFSFLWAIREVCLISIERSQVKEGSIRSENQVASSEALAKHSTATLETEDQEREIDELLVQKIDEAVRNRSNREDRDPSESKIDQSFRRELEDLLTQELAELSDVESTQGEFVEPSAEELENVMLSILTIRHLDCLAPIIEMFGGEEAYNQIPPFTFKGSENIDTVSLQDLPHPISKGETIAGRTPLLIKVRSKTAPQNEAACVLVIRSQPPYDYKNLKGSWGKVEKAENLVELRQLLNGEHPEYQLAH